MNRHDRRAAKARYAKSFPVTATHEAGHAVARVLTASDFGITEADAVDRIEVGLSSNTYGVSRNGPALLFSQATTYGPILSATLERFFHEVNKGLPGDQIRQNHFIKAFQAAESAGEDNSGWLRARMLIAVFGAAAEARHRGRDILHIWHGYEAECDLDTARRDGLYAGLSSSQTADFINEAIGRAEYLILQPHVWAAVTSVAENMPKHGTMSGERVVGLVQAAFKNAVH
jgi:hypothetical protein